MLVDLLVVRSVSAEEHVARPRPHSHRSQNAAFLHQPRSYWWVSRYILPSCLFIPLCEDEEKVRIIVTRLFGELLREMG